VIVLVETVAAAILVVLVAGSLRSPGTPTPAQVVAMLVASLACGALVVATCMSLSVRRPHRAELNGPRDAVAPPGALAMASVRLAMPPAFIGFLIEESSRPGIWWLPALMGAPIIAFAVVWLRHSQTMYDHPLVRARIVQTVSAG
jgi:hypothetical protein